MSPLGPIKTNSQSYFEWLRNTNGITYLVAFNFHSFEVALFGKERERVSGC